MENGLSEGSKTKIKEQNPEEENVEEDAPLSFYALQVFDLEGE